MSGPLKLLALVCERGEGVREREGRVREWKGMVAREREREREREHREMDKTMEEARHM